MSDDSNIEWTDATWNPVRGCDKVSAGCKNCYAETFAERWRGTPGHPFEQGFDLRLVPEKLDQPLRWTRPRRIFVNSMSDLFHEDVPDAYIAQVVDVMRRASQHTFQLLTKRAERLLAWSTANLPDGFPANVWVGVSVEDARRLNERVPLLQRVRASVRFLSMEPLLGRARLDEVFGLQPGNTWSPCLCAEIDPSDVPCIVCESRRALGEASGIHWVIVGGESGPGARPMDLEWAREIRDACRAAGVAFFFKQTGYRSPLRAKGDAKGGTADSIPSDLLVREYPEVSRA